MSAPRIDGYLGRPDDDAPDILPEETQHLHQLIALFEAEKAFYELSYELNNWLARAWIPMRGISKLFTQKAHASHPEEAGAKRSATEGSLSLEAVQQPWRESDPSSLSLLRMTRGISLRELPAPERVARLRIARRKPAPEPVARAATNRA